MSAINMLLKFVCLIIITIFFRWYRQFYKQIPMHCLSLTHMVNYDLAAHYYLIHVSYCLCSVPIDFGWTLDPFVAHILVAVFAFFMYGVAMYCTITVVIQYLHVYYRQTSVSGILTDNEVQKLTLVVTSAIGTALQGCRMLINDRPAMFNMMVREPESKASVFGPIILTLLLLIALAANVVLRIIMKSKKTLVDLSLGYTSAENYSHHKHVWMKYLMLVVMFLLLSLMFLIMYVMFQPAEAYYVAGWYINVQLSVILPILCTCSHKPLRQFVAKKLKQSYNNYVCS